MNSSFVIFMFVFEDQKQITLLVFKLVEHNFRGLDKVWSALFEYNALTHGLQNIKRK
jgi:hypothetical protein